MIDQIANQKLSFSICMPVYKGHNLIKQAIDSLIYQQFQDFEIIIGEDTPMEFKEEIKRIEAVIQSYNDPRIRYYKNSVNLGYAINLRTLVNKATKDIVFLMAQDDILAYNALKMVHHAFLLDSTIGAVTRPYFWFYDSPKKPVRVVSPYNENKDSIISVFDGEHEFGKIFESVGQLSGLAYRRSMITVPFDEECFPAHIYPFAGILLNHKCVFLKDYTVAVGIKNSQTRSVSSIYDISPMDSWARMFKTVFSGKQYEKQLQWGRKHVYTNYLGLVQLKNYANYKSLINEIKILVFQRPSNLIKPAFWFFSIGSLVIPKFILRQMVDSYKTHINSKLINIIDFKYYGDNGKLT